VKDSLQEGIQEQMSFTVTEEMFAKFGEKLIHPTYSTVSMVYHMEWVAYKLLLPHLEEDEVGMGAEVVVKHLAPSLEGSKVTLTATVTNIKPNRLTTDITIHNDEGLIGEGKVVQAIVAKEKAKELFYEKTNK